MQRACCTFQSSAESHMHEISRTWSRFRVPVMLASFLVLSCYWMSAQKAHRNSVFYVNRADTDVKLEIDPSAPFWRKAHSVFADVDKQGSLERGHRTEVRSRWTKES